MFGWFSPICPLDSVEQVWTELRMRWLADQFGIDRLLDAEVVLPNEDFFPEEYHGTPEDAERMLQQLCRYMDADPSKLKLEIVPDDKMPQAAGLYQRRPTGSLIQVAQSKLAEPQHLAATLAHEISHELLLGAGRLHADEEDHELVTDLLPVFLGVGVFAANATVTTQFWQSGILAWSRFSRLGYLPARMFGYAFALFAFMRGEENPDWADSLRLDASSVLRAGLRYLGKSKDSLFHPDTIDAGRPQLSPAAATAGLRHAAVSVRLATLWELRKTPLTERDVLEATMTCLHDRDPHIPGEAARTLAALGPGAAISAPQLRRAARSSNTSTRLGAIFALGVIRAEPEEAIALLTALLGEVNLRVVESAAKAVSAYGHHASSATGALLDALTGAVIECDDPAMRALCDAVAKVAPDASEQLRTYFSKGDREVRRLALQVYREQNGIE